MNFEEKFGKQSCTILYKEERKAGGLLCVRKSRHCCCVSVASVSCLHDATDPDEVLVVVNQKLPIKISKFQKKNGNSAFKKLGMTSCLKALIVTWQCYNNSISCFEAAMKCKVWLTLICPMPNHQLVRCKRLDGGPQHTAPCCRCTLFSSPIVCTVCCARCADCAVHIVNNVLCTLCRLCSVQLLCSSRSWNHKGEGRMRHSWSERHSSCGFNIVFFMWWKSEFHSLICFHLLPRKKERGAEVRKTKEEEDGQKFFFGDWSSWRRLSGEFLSLSRKKVLPLNKRSSR